MKLHFPAVFLWGGEKVVFPDGRLFNTRYTEETHSKNSTYHEFCASKTRAGGATLNHSNIVLCRMQEVGKFKV